MSCRPPRTADSAPVDHAEGCCGLSTVSVRPVSPFLIPVHPSACKARAHLFPERAMREPGRLRRPGEKENPRRGRCSGGALPYFVKGGIAMFYGYQTMGMVFGFHTGQFRGHGECPHRSFAGRYGCSYCQKRKTGRTLVLSACISKTAVPRRSRSSLPPSGRTASP